MTLFQAAVLGVTQGVTEFLPISSDGHLWIVYRLFRATPNLAFEVFLHGATLLVLVIYFRREIGRVLTSLLPSHREMRAERRLAVLIVIGTLVSGAIALLMGNAVDAANKSGVWVGLGFLVTAALIALAEWIGPRVRSYVHASDLPWWKAVPIGVLQAVAVLPGVSRSGSTISAGMLSGLDRAEAARFSFLLGIPIIALAAAKDVLDVMSGSAAMPGFVASAVGFVIAGVSGYLAIWGLLGFVRRHSLWWFGAYTAVIGTAILVWTLAR